MGRRGSSVLDSCKILSRLLSLLFSAVAQFLSPVFMPLLASLHSLAASQGPIEPRQEAQVVVSLRKVSFTSRSVIKMLLRVALDEGLWALVRLFLEHLARVSELQVGAIIQSTRILRIVD